MRYPSKVLVGLVLTSLTLGACASTGDSATQPAPPQNAAPTSDAGSLVIIRGIDQTDAEAIQTLAARDAEYRASALTYLTQVGPELAATSQLPGSEGLTGTSINTLVDELSSMTGDTQPLSPDVYKTLPSPSGQNTNNPQSADAAGPLTIVNPNGFPVQGSKQGDGSYWIGNPMVGLVRSVCDRQGNCTA